MVQESLVIYDENDCNNYFVIAHNMLGSYYGDHTFLVYVNGDSKKLYRLYKKYNELFVGRILYTFKETNYLKNNSIEIERGLYEFVI